MPPVLAVDVLRLLINYLKIQSEIVAIVSTRVYGSLPDGPQFPCLTLTRIGGLARTPHYQDDAQIQVNCWGRTSDEARLLSRTSHAALKAVPQVHSLGVVVSLRTVLGESYQPDPTYSPARERWIFGVVCTTRPL